jgi:hypothetical protein
VTFTRTATVNAMMLEPAHYPALRTFFSNMTAADQLPLVLAKGAAK